MYPLAPVLVAVSFANRDGAVVFTDDYLLNLDNQLSVLLSVITGEGRGRSGAV